MSEQAFDVVIIGGGAAGLMCAIECGKRGRRTIVIDHANRIGKKILLSGGGRCNFTNINATPRNFLSSNPHFAKSALARYTPDDFVKLVEAHSIPYHEKKLGQLFCDDSAKRIVEMLADECRRNGVQILAKCATEAIESTPPRYRICTNRGTFNCRSLVIATGGLSFPTMGASDFGHRIARQFGLDVLPTRPGLVPFTLEGELLELAHGLAGVSLDCLAHADNAMFRENLLFTHRGLSGPSILQVSSFWTDGNAVHINLIPDRDAGEWLLEAKSRHAKRRLKTVLAEKLPGRFINAIEGEWFTDRLLAECRDSTLLQLGRQLNDWHVVPSGTEGYRTAEVTLGGVNTNELSSKTMEARKQRGLFFIGEVLDVTGWLGGYNFQWAWASGHAAGQVA